MNLAAPPRNPTISIVGGVKADKILYDYDYQRQLLVVSAIRDKLNENLRDLSVNESIKAVAQNTEFYGPDFLLKRPVIEALTMKGHKVLLIDEIDKTEPEIEHALLEMLSDFAITIPEYGTIQCAPEDRPIVFLTSNNYRELSQPMLRPRRPGIPRFQSWEVSKQIKFFTTMTTSGNCWWCLPFGTSSTRTSGI